MLELSDLEVICGHVHIRDLRLAERLGLRDVHSIRRVIELHRQPLIALGELISRPDRKIGAGRPSASYYLNKKQALYVTAKSNAPAAADFTIQILEAIDTMPESLSLCDLGIIKKLSPPSKTIIFGEKRYARNIFVNINKLIQEAIPIKQEYTIPGSNGRSRVDIAIRVKGRLIPVEVKLRARRRDLFQALEYVDLMKSPYGYLITQTDHTGVDFATANNQVRMLVVAGCDKRLV